MNFLEPAVLDHTVEVIEKIAVGFLPGWEERYFLPLIWKASGSLLCGILGLRQVSRKTEGSGERS